MIALAAQRHLPAMYEGREFVEDGGLISYGPDIVEMTRRSAAIVDKISPVSSSARKRRVLSLTCGAKCSHKAARRGDRCCFSC